MFGVLSRRYHERTHAGPGHVCLPLLWPPVCVSVLHPSRGGHDVMHSGEELTIVFVDGRLAILFDLRV